MRWGYHLLLLFGFIASVNAAGPARLIHEAESKFKDGRLQEGKALLESSANADHLSVVEQAAVNNKLAWFYEERVGNYPLAERYSRKVLQYSLPASHRAVVEAQNRIERIKLYAAKYRTENQIIKKMKIDASSSGDAIYKIRQLQQLIQNRPDYPDLPVAHHYIGKHYLYLEKYYRSYAVLANVLKTRPGIVFLLPTESLMNTAKSKWIYFLADTSARLIIMTSLLAIFILLLRSKFWQWMDFKFLFILPIVILLWGVFLMGGAWGLNFLIPDQPHLYLEKPYFIQSNPFSPGSEILFKIFLYGVLGILGSFLLTLATQNLKWPKIRMLVNCMVVVLLTGSVLTLFYFNNCHPRGIFEKRANSVLPVVTGHTYLREQDYEPLVLTNPKRYPDLSLTRCDDQHFRDWVSQQYSIIASQSAEDTALK